MGIETAIGLGVAGATGAASGKKGGGNDQANQQLALQEQQLELQTRFADIGEQYFDLATPFLQQSGDYFSSLLEGGQPARLAVAPAAAEIGNVYGAASRDISTFLPRGGERNLALAQTDIARSGDLSRLYAGVQPQAAAALASLFGLSTQAGTGAAGTSVGFGSVGAGAGGTLLDFYAKRDKTRLAGALGIGRGLGDLAAKVGVKDRDDNGGGIKG